MCVILKLKIKWTAWTAWTKRSYNFGAAGMMKESRGACSFGRGFLGGGVPRVPISCLNPFLGFAKAPRLNDQKSTNIRNMGRLSIVQPRELSRGLKRGLSRKWGPTEEEGFEPPLALLLNLFSNPMLSSYTQQHPTNFTGKRQGVIPVILLPLIE